MHAVGRVINLVIGCAFIASPAFAHPHVWIDAKAAIIFNDDGALSTVHNSWTFDAAYSAWVVQGLDANNDGKLSRAELQPFANDSMQSLAEYGYFTTAGEDEHDIAFMNGDQAVASYDGTRVTLDFLEPLAKPYVIERQAEIGIYDPDYYVDIAFPEPGDVFLVNAPQDCHIELKPPQTMSDALAEKLYAIPADITKIPTDLERELRKIMGAILVRCANAPVAARPPASALDAAGAMAGGILAQSDVEAVAAAQPSRDATPHPAPIPNWRNSATSTPTEIGVAASGVPMPTMPPVSIMTARLPPGETANQATDAAAPSIDSTTTTAIAAAPPEPPTPYASGVSASAPMAPPQPDANGETEKTSVASAETSLLRLPTLKPAPFDAPQTEPGLIMPRIGMLAVIIDLQRRFYGAMTSALARLHSDNNAFWLLGALSFLYGIFHAAGPGHGKIVISSYLLANDQQLRRGLLLSLISAMMQSSVAVAFILAATALLHLSSAMMSQAANWMVAGSYGLVALLGAWLIVRHVFFGHHHAHGHDEHDHDHHHNAEDGHLHVVPADRIKGGWREKLAVVISVGTRPCSGALIVLVFALSQGVLAAGVAAVYLMGLGTAITVSMLAVFATSARGVVLRFAALGGNSTASYALWWIELAGAVVVFTFGILLLLASF